VVNVGFDAAFDALYEPTERLATALVGDAVLGDEITIEALAHVCVEWRRIQRRKPDATHCAALVVTTVAIDAVARREPIEGIAEPDASDLRLRHDEAIALRALSRRRREIVALSFYAQLSVDDIAALLRMPPKKVAPELRAARDELSVALGVLDKSASSGTRRR
jgi:DNA-directed RNA polymerase specialized sigma24 family protein